MERISTILCGKLHGLDTRSTGIKDPIGSPGARLARGAKGLAWGTIGEGPMGHLMTWVSQGLLWSSVSSSRAASLFIHSRASIPEANSMA